MAVVAVWLWYFVLPIFFYLIFIGSISMRWHTLDGSPPTIVDAETIHDLLGHTIQAQQMLTKLDRPIFANRLKCNVIAYECKPFYGFHLSHNNVKG